MFDISNESVTESSEYGNDEFESAVDLINSAEASVKTVADVKKKTRQVNLGTVVNTLKAITDEELEDCKPIVMRELLVEATRLNSAYKNIIG